MVTEPIESPLSVDEAFTMLQTISRRCKDINFKVVTTDDIYTSLGLDEGELSTECEAEIREAIRNSWEMKHWSDMFDDDWQFFSYMDFTTIQKILDKYGEELPSWL